MTKTKTPRKKKERLPPEPHWSSLVGTLLQFLATKFEGKPKLRGSDGRDLKGAARALRIRAEGIGVKWEKDIACRTLRYFLEFAWANNDMGVIPHSDKWFLPYVNKYKNEIIEQIHQFKLQKSHESKV